MAGVIGIIQGRMGSTRLPAKLLAPIAGRPLLQVLVERLRRSGIKEWWLATTDAPEDDVTAAWGAALGIRVYRGDPQDVLSRFAAIVAERDPAWVVRVTADDPFIDRGVVDALVEQARTAVPTIDVVGEGAARRLPLGYAPEMVRGPAVTRSAMADLPSHHRAHVTSWLRESGAVLSFEVPAAWPPRPHWRWTVDTPDDLAMADAAFRAFGADWATIAYPTMVRVMDDHPEITTRNEAIRQKSVAEG